MTGRLCIFFSFLWSTFHSCPHSPFLFTSKTFSALLHLPLLLLHFYIPFYSFFLLLYTLISWKFSTSLYTIFDCSRLG